MNFEVAEQLKRSEKEKVQREILLNQIGTESKKSKSKRKRKAKQRRQKDRINVSNIRN